MENVFLRGNSLMVKCICQPQNRASQQSVSQTVTWRNPFLFIFQWCDSCQSGQTGENGKESSAGKEFISSAL